MTQSQRILLKRALGCNTQMEGCVGRKNTAFPAHTSVLTSFWFKKIATGPVNKAEIKYGLPIGREDTKHKLCFLNWHLMILIIDGFSLFLQETGPQPVWNISRHQRGSGRGMLTRPRPVDASLILKQTWAGTLWPALQDEKETEMWMLPAGEVGMLVWSFYGCFPPPYMQTIN